MAFIHPFMDGNGRMGRLWQTLILMSQYPIFEFLPFETFISQHQKDYYQALSKSDKIGHSTPFIEFILNMLNQALSEVLQFNNRIMTDQDRIEYFISLNKGPFTRKDYMDVFKNISSASASRDLKKAVYLNLLLKKGIGNQTIYLSVVRN
jgi:Fic family protein